MRWLTRYFARAVVRRVVYLFVGLVFAWLAQSCGRASAAVPAISCVPTGTCDQGVAFSEATGFKAYAAQRCIDVAGPAGVPSGVTVRPAGSKSYEVIFQCVWGSGPNAGGVIGNELFGAFSWVDTCASRNANPLADAAPWYFEPATCVGGCAVQGTSFTSTNGGAKTYGMKDRSYNGSTCDPQKPSNDISQARNEASEATTPKQPECTALGSGQTACVKPNGDTCATSSTGKTFCWQPGETGKKTDSNDAQVKSPKGDAVTPPDVKISDKDWQRTEGHQQTACINDRCTTYNVTNFQSVPAGTQKNGTGDNASDGSGNTSGNGKPGSGKDDDGKEDSASESGNCDVPPICVGDTLKCLQLKFTWKIDCNTQGSEITKGDGCGEGDVPVCAGKSCKAEAYSQVLQQWKQRCAVEAMGQGMATRAAGISNGDDVGVVEGIWGGQSGGTGLTLRQDLVNVGGGGNARLLPDVEIEGHAWTVPQGFYDAILAVKMVIIAMCTVIAMFVVGRNI